MRVRAASLSLVTEESVEMVQQPRDVEFQYLIQNIQSALLRCKNQKKEKGTIVNKTCSISASHEPHVTVHMTPSDGNFKTCKDLPFLRAN